VLTRNYRSSSTGVTVFKTLLTLVARSSASAVLRGVEIFIPLEGLIDLEVERQKIQKEITRLEGSLAGIEKKLSNEKFVANASPEIVEKERAKQKDWLDNIAKLKEILNNLN